MFRLTFGPLLSAACTAHIIDKLKMPPTPAAKGGFPLVCTNDARGSVLHKAHSTIGDCSACDEKKVADESPTNTNPYLNETVIIDKELLHTPLDMALAKKPLGLAHCLGILFIFVQLFK
jgi:hypothetical protein